MSPAQLAAFQAASGVTAPTLARCDRIHRFVAGIRVGGVGNARQLPCLAGR